MKNYRKKLVLYSTCSAVCSCVDVVSQFSRPWLWFRTDRQRWHV